MKKIFLLGALVASTMAFASMESNSVLDTLKSGSVTVKGGLIFDGNSTPSKTYKINPEPTEADKAKADKDYANIESESLPSFGGGLEVEYSVPVYNINDDMSVLLAAGLNGSVKYSSYKSGKVQKYKLNEENKHVEPDGEAQEGSSKFVMTSISALVGPRFSYKLNDDMKLIAGVNLGIGGEIHSQVSTAASESAKSEYMATKAAKDTNSKDARDKNNHEIDDNKLTNIKKVADEGSHTTSTLAFPMAAVLGVDYKNIVVTANLGGKVLAPKFDDKDMKNTDVFSYDEVQKIKYNSTASEDSRFSNDGKSSINPKFIFSAGLKVGYRFDLDKFTK